MHLIHIDTTHCVRCNQCVAACPSRLIVQETPQSYPRRVADADERCIACMHCTAICPVGVIAIDEIDRKMCQPVPKESMPRFEHIATLARTRRSIRNYSAKPVEKAKLEQVLDVVRWAPTAKNGLPVRWVVANRRELIAELAGMIVEWMRNIPECRPAVDAWDRGVDMVTRGAPCLIVAYTEKDALWPAMDATIAVETLDLCATAMRLGCCWAGYFILAAQSDRKIAKRLGLTDSQTVQAALMLGYPANESYTRIPWRKELDIRWLE